MNFQFKKSGCEVGASDRQHVGSHPKNVARRTSGRKVGGDGANHGVTTIGIAPLSETPGSDAGGAQAVKASTSHEPVPAAKSSRRRAGASDAVAGLLSTHHAHPGNNSGREVGDGRAAVCSQPIHAAPAVRTSGALASGDEAESASVTREVMPHREQPGRKAGAGRTTVCAETKPDTSDPQTSGSDPGADRASQISLPHRAARDQQNSGSGRGDEGLGAGDDHSRRALVAELVQLGRARRDWMKTRIGIELRAIAICRRFTAGDKDAAMVLWKGVREGVGPADLMFAVGPLLGPIDVLKDQEVRVDRQMTKLAARHDLAGWAKAIRGFGHAGLAKVIAECGEIGSYRNPSCVWKRMGLAVIEGGRQRRVPGAAALDHGYNAERRSVMWNVGGAVIGGMGKGPRPVVGEDIEARDDLTVYQKLFVRRLRFEAERDPENHARPPVENKETGVLKESFSAHAANRAKRYVEKRLLRDLWIAWRREGQPPFGDHLASALSPTPSAAQAERRRGHVRCEFHVIGAAPSPSDFPS